MTTRQHRSRLPSVATSRVDTLETASIGSRQRQSKKDEAIRRKLEQELSKKRQSSSRIRHNNRKIPGTVSSLRPSQALTVKENLLVIEASQLMAAKRGDSVLVVDENDHLSGIFTAKDLAYRVVAGDLDPRTTTVADIMTKQPMCVTADTSATDALNLMVSRGFRHLPVCNDEGDIFGLLDITKCFYEALGKMERAFGSSQKLYDALQGVEREWSNGPIQLVQYMEALRDQMSCPDLTSVMDGTDPAQVNIKANVREVARLMKEHHTTAVLVTDREGLAGIFTTKDIVLRVIAAGLTPDNCSVVRVMTPNPDTATSQTTIMEALRRMHDGHFLNLPVVDDGFLVGIVDVLKLTYAALEQINSIQGNDNEGPMWSRFWDNFGHEATETESQISDQMSGHLQSTTLSGITDVTRAKHAISPEEPLQDLQEVTPNESASMIAHERQHHHHDPHDDAHSVSSQPLTATHAASTVLHNKEEESRMVFKYKLPNGQSHRFLITEPTFEQVLDAVRPKMIHDHLEWTHEDDDGSSDWLTISYVDDEEDQVLMTSDADVRDALQLARKMNQDRVKLFVVDRQAAAAIASPVPNGSTLPTTSRTTTPLPIHMHEEKLGQPTLDASIVVDHQADEEDAPAAKTRRPRSNSNDFEIAGIPQELLLPAAITFLGVAILGVFAFSRMKPQYR
ncbi:CBS-domain-containing protein [Hesseltinella vesiculosa]|uniref:CBS-domain-containing protein n=1 Tax=Hesseltinella vesiculosa TaxID=101127 RepID=A0A1X2GIQ2_9FUNG|nr:CBS-domain-containing protein [Hesseltinella vesiculosa]